MRSPVNHGQGRITIRLGCNIWKDTEEDRIDGDKGGMNVGSPAPRSVSRVKGQMPNQLSNLIPARRQCSPTVQATQCDTRLPIRRDTPTTPQPHSLAFTHHSLIFHTSMPAN